MPIAGSADPLAARPPVSGASAEPSPSGPDSALMPDAYSAERSTEPLTARRPVSGGSAETPSSPWPNPPRVPGPESPAARRPERGEPDASSPEADLPTQPQRRPRVGGSQAEGCEVPSLVQCLPALLDIANEAVAVARRIIRSRAPGSVHAKGDRDIVTDVDLAVEDAVREFLCRETPGIGILGEEHGRTGPGGDAPWWALDPVDGTANLACGMPLCAVSLALVSGGHAALAAVDLPFLDARYTAVAGRGAYVNGERILTSRVREPSDAVVSIGDFAVGPGAEPRNRVRIALLNMLGARVRRIRMLGTAAIDLAWVAEGKLDASIILANMPWDTMAGVLLVREAGGFVLDRDGCDHTVASAATVAVAPALRDPIMATLRRAYEQAEENCLPGWRPARDTGTT